MTEPSDEKGAQQVGPDKPSREGESESTETPPATKELPTVEANEAAKSDDVDGPDDFGPTTEYGSE